MTEGQISGFWGGSGYIKSSKPLAPRAAFDLYPTPYLLAQKAIGLLPDSLNPRRILDPGAGPGAWGYAARERWELSDIDAVEIRTDAPVQPCYTTWYNSDFLKVELTPGYDLVIGNPPFDKDLAQKFVEKSLSLVREGGYVLFMLRLAFLESKKRYETLFLNRRPVMCYTLVERPSFTDNGKTDATAYALYLWQKGNYNNMGMDFLSWKPKPVKRSRSPRGESLLTTIES